MTIYHRHWLDAEEIILLTIAIEIGKPDECLEIYHLIDVLWCGNHSTSRIMDSEPFIIIEIMHT